jgi:hypothetical protein
MISTKKNIDETLITSAIISSINSGNKSLIERSFETILQYISNNWNNISHSFWQTSIEAFIKIEFNDLAYKLIKLYPIKYSYSESLWKNIILSHTTDDLITIIFELFVEKFDHRTNKDEFRGFDVVFNLFIEEIANN